jgi:hypothetical protein
MKSAVGRVLACVAAGIFCLLASPAHGQTVLVTEGFNDAALVSRGWYDGLPALTTAEKYTGAGAMECRFALAATGCTGGSTTRHGFTETESLYVSFYMKHSSNWVGSGKPYHPHLFVMTTNLDGPYNGPAYTKMTAYIEQNGGIPRLSIQDGRNIDENRVGQDLTNITEQRAVAGCNGDSDGHGNGDCYRSGTVHWNGKVWQAGQVYFDSTPGSPRYKGDWHLVEGYFRLNTIVNGKGARDGVLQMWYDGVLIIDEPNVVMRTGANPTMKFNQLILAPYIGDGSPVAQSLWIDDLIIATGRPLVPPTPPGGGSSSGLPAAPTNLRIVP